MRQPLVVLLWLVLLLLAAPLEAAEVAPAPFLPGTRWQLEPADWSSLELEALSALVPRLPSSWVLQRSPLLLRRLEAPPLPPDPFAPDLLARADVRHHRIDLAIGGLEARLNAWLEHPPEGVRLPPRDRLLRILIQRQWIHALGHVEDRRLHLSRARLWRQIAWSRSLLSERPAERHPDGFVNVHGRMNPLKDLATSLEAWFVPEGFLTSPSDLHPRCRLGARWRFLREALGDPPPAQDVPVCARLEEVGLGLEEVDDLTLVYVAASASEVASIAGHVLLGVHHRPDALGNSRSEAYGLVAMTGGLQGGPRYAWYGLTGGFTSSITWEPFDGALLRYSEQENRDVRRYRLRLTPAQKQRLLTRLDELRQAWDRPYYFFQRNCTQLGLELMRAAMGPDFRPPQPLGPDVFLAYVARLDLIEPIPPERPQELALRARATAARSLRAASAARLLEANPSIHQPLELAFSAVSEDAVTPRVSGYAALGALASRLEAPSTLPELVRYLLWSDPIEQSRHLKARLEGTPEIEPAIDAIREALWRVREAAADPAVPLPSARESQQRLLEAMVRDRTSLSSHTSYQPLSLLPGLGFDPTGRSIDLEIGGQFYGYHRGDPRQFGLTEGMELELLTTRIRLGISPSSRQRIALEVSSISYIPDLERPFPLGWYTRLLHLEVGSAAPFRGRWIEGGLMTSLFRSHHYARSLNLGMGAGLESEIGSTVLTLPLTLELRLGSRFEPLSSLQMRSSWSPLLAPGQAVSQALRVNGRVRRRLGEVAGIDVAVGIEYGGEWRGVLMESLEASEQSVRGGLWVERF